MFIQMPRESWAIGFLMSDATRIYSHTLDTTVLLSHRCLVLNDNAIRFFQVTLVSDSRSYDDWSMYTAGTMSLVLVYFKITLLLLLLSVSFALCFFLFFFFFFLKLSLFFRFFFDRWLGSRILSVSKKIQDSRELLSRVKISAEILLVLFRSCLCM